jgi:Phosphoesterase family
MRYRSSEARRIGVSLGFAAVFLGMGLLQDPSSSGGQVRSAADGAPGRIFDRIFIVVLENTWFARAKQAPFLQHLATRGALFTDYYAITHPSYPNYLAMVTGSTLGVQDDTQRDFDATSLVDLLEPAGVSWKVYAENLPSPCFLGARSPDGLYVRKHEPYISLRNIQGNPARCARIVNAAQLSADLDDDALPQYSLYVPNVRHDGHDTSIGEADAWLRTFLTPLLQNPHFMRRTLLVITFDEDSGFWTNRIYTAFVGDMVQLGVTNGNPYNHYSLLRLIEDNFGVGTLNREDSRATPICCIWNNR